MSFSALDRLLRVTAGADAGVPGAVILVRQGTRILFHEAYGYSQIIPGRRPMTRDTLFDLASLTKPICTGLLSVQLFQEGKFPLDTPLSFWFASPGDPGKERITPRNLLCNRSGLPPWMPFYRDYTAGECPVPRDEIRATVLETPLESSPGRSESYSDLGFMLAGWILERQAEMTLDELFRQRIAGPLGLQGLGFRGVGQQGDASRGREGGQVAATENCPWRGRVVRGEVHDENCYLMGGVAGHAGLFSSAGELDRVVQEIFAAGKGASGLFSHDALRTFFQKQEPSTGGTWALGWDTPSAEGSTSGRYYSAESFGHTGFTGTSLWIDLRRKISVILLTNRVHPSRENGAIRLLRPRAHNLIMEELLGGGILNGC
jgi:CubicO group peptidase (beta-lactamase class C family)